MKVFNHPQGSEQWFKERAGRATASRFSDILTPGGKLSKSADGLILKLLTEQAAPEHERRHDSVWFNHGFTGNQFTDRGNDLEPEALEVFRQQTGLDAKSVGLVVRDDGVVGASPDAVIGDLETPFFESGVEIKCPLPHTHLYYLLKGELPPKYKPQVHGQMVVCDTENWWFMSYCPDLKPLIVEVRRDSYTAALEQALDDFLLRYAELKIELGDITAPTARTTQETHEPPF